MKPFLIGAMGLFLLPFAPGCGSTGGDDAIEPDAGDTDASTPFAGDLDASTPFAGDADASAPDAGDPDASALGLWPTDRWETSTPEAQGVDSAQLADVLRLITENDLKVHSIFVARNGVAILDAVFYPFVLSEGSHDFASVTKAITVTLIGIAIDKGYVDSTEERLLDFFPDRIVENADANKKSITIEDLLTMRSGFQCGHDDEKELMEMVEVIDNEWVQYALDLPMETEPGRDFAYCSPNTHLLSAILTEATGMSELEFAQEHLFGPLGIRDVMWTTDPQGVTRGWGDLFLRPTDMAKIGYLYLNGGIWNGERIVSSDWLQKAVQRHTALSDAESYGYHWMSNQAFPGVHYAKGRGGQQLIFWPEKDIVAVLTGGRNDVDDYNVPLAASVVSDNALADNPRAFADLRAEISRIQRAPVPKPVPALPELAYAISGKTYLLEDNRQGVESVTFDFDDGDEAQLHVHSVDNLTGSETDATLPVGLDDVYRISPGLYQGTPMGLKGYWASEEEFVLFVTAIASYSSVKWVARFAGDEAIIDVVEESGLWQQSITGVVSTAP